MKWFPDCSGECCVCACGGNCLVGNGDDGFSPATNEQILERLKNGNYPNYRRTMINELAMRGIVYDTNPTEKMTDNEIIKALECCGKNTCRECIYNTSDDRFDLTCTTNMAKDALDIINRQQTEIDILIRKKETLRDEIAEKQAEIDKLTNELEYLNGKYLIQDMAVQSANSEARKEFAERLKDMHKHNTTSVVSLVTVFDNINNLLEEMECEDNA